MKYKNKLIIIYFIALANSLLSQNITLQYVGNSDEEIHMEYFTDNFIATQAAIKSTDRTITFNAAANTAILCNDVFRRTNIYAEPNDSILFDIDQNRLIRYYSNSNKYRKTESEFINECFTKYGVNEIESRKKITIIVSQGFNLSEYIDSKYIKEQELLDKYYTGNKVSKSFYNYFKNLFWCMATNNLMDNINDEPIAVLAIEQSFKKSNELMALLQYRELVYNYNLKIFTQSTSNTDLLSQLQFVYKKDYLPEIKNFLLYNSMANHLEENPDVTKIDKNAVAFFNNYCSDLRYTERIGKQLQPPAIPLIIDELVKRNRGKLVLIDFWASWCAPCRAEFPAEKKLMEKHPEMAFIFFSVDSEISAWQQAMNAYPDILNKSNSFLLTRSDHLEIIDKLKLNTIPRYLLFDKHGKVITVDAPRPSSEEIEILINQQ